MTMSIGARPERRISTRGAASPGSRFSEVWAAIASDPYLELPKKRVTAGSVWDFVRKNIYADARRTLTTDEDLVPPYDKLVHPVGICLRGYWRIHEHTPYTGLFRSGSQALIIARASDGVGEHRPGRLRFMGLAGKLYPTTDPEHESALPTANFVTLENLGGTRTPHFVDATLSTDLLPLMPHAELLSKLAPGVIAGLAFAAADRTLGPTQALIRQLYPIAELDEEPGRPTCAPAVMRIVGTELNRRIDAPDLREELAIVNHPHGLRFHVQVADRRSYLFARGFRTIGELHFTESVASHTGDHRLHFPHAPYRHGRDGGATSRSD